MPPISFSFFLFIVLCIVPCIVSARLFTSSSFLNLPSLVITQGAGNTSSNTSSEDSDSAACPEAPRNMDEELKNTTIFYSSDSPLYSVFCDGKDKNMSESYNRLLNFAAHMDRSVVSASEANDPAEEVETEESDLLSTCSSRNDDWKDDLPEYAYLRCWSINTTCISDIIGTNEAKKIKDPNKTYNAPSEGDVYQWVVQHAELIEDKAEAAADRARVNWTEAYRGTKFEYNSKTQKCDYNYMGFFKHAGNWFIAERITNSDKRYVAQTNTREYLFEYIRPEGVLTLSLKDNSTSDLVRKNGTTAFMVVGGADVPSAFGDLKGSDNPAVAEALRKGDHNAQQADDATTPSNIAILAFPLVMNIVPVALIADVNSIGMLVYTLLTDVLTAVPLAIKGVEVFGIGTIAQTTAISRISGANIGMVNETTGIPHDKVMELWVAKCRAEESLRSTGIILLTVALLFMVGGIIAEFVAKQWTTRQGAGRVVEDPWTGADVPLMDVVSGDLEPVSATTTVPQSLGATSSAFMLASAAAIRERENAHDANQPEASQRSSSAKSGTGDQVYPAPLRKQPDEDVADNEGEDVSAVPNDRKKQAWYFRFFFFLLCLIRIHATLCMLKYVSSAVY